MSQEFTNSQQQSDDWSDQPESGENESSFDSNEFKMLEVKEGMLGCKHYSRACQKQCPNPICEGKYYPCRLCHDEIFESQPKLYHQFDRHKVINVKCLHCNTEQPKSRSCTNCNQDFASYYCEKCSFYDNNGAVKKVYHCEKCGICRVGGRESQFHCDICACCYNISMLNNHTCKDNRFKMDCPVCLTDMNNSILASVITECGHSMHAKCMKEYSKTNIACPLCKKSLWDIKSQEAFFDQQLAECEMPKEYKNMYMTVICNDCLHQSKVKFHILGGKCDQCKSYNTTQAAGGLQKAENGSKVDSDEEQENELGQQLNNNQEEEEKKE